MLQAILCCLGLVLPLHDGLHEQIAALTAEIAARPEDAALYVRRADLYRAYASCGSGRLEGSAAEQVKGRA